MKSEGDAMGSVLAARREDEKSQGLYHIQE